MELELPTFEVTNLYQDLTAKAWQDTGLNVAEERKIDEELQMSKDEYLFASETL